jgi:hypothetical protein
MTNMFRKAAVAVKGGPAGVGVWANAVRGSINFGRLFIDRSGSGEASQESIRTNKVMSTGAANLTLTAKDDGAIVFFNDATSRIVSLPATAKGLTFLFVIGTVTAGAGHKIDPAAADKITGNGLALADGVAIECDGATDRAGDILELTGDGNDGWIVTRVIGTWSSE